MEKWRQKPGLIGKSQLDLTQNACLFENKQAFQ
jgi:hypothetical protein